MDRHRRVWCLHTFSSLSAISLHTLLPTCPTPLALRAEVPRFTLGSYNYYILAPFESDAFFKKTLLYLCANWEVDTDWVVPFAFPHLPFNPSLFPLQRVRMSFCVCPQNVVMRPDRPLRGARTSATSIRCTRYNATLHPDKVPLPPSA